MILISYLQALQQFLDKYKNQLNKIKLVLESSILC